MVATSTLAAPLLIPFVLQGELAGRVYLGDCDSNPVESVLPRFQDVVLASSFTDPGGLEEEARPIVINAGDLLSPGPPAGTIVAMGGKAQDLLAGVLMPEGRPIYDVVLPGNLDLSVSRRGLRSLTGKASIPWTIGNLSPRFSRLRERMLYRGLLRVGVAAAIDEVLAPKLHPRTRGERLAPAAPSLDASIRRLRTGGAQLVVVVLHVSRTEGYAGVIRILNAMTETPDLVLTSALGGEVQRMDLGGRQVSVISAPSEPGRVAVAVMRLDEEGKASLKSTWMTSIRVVGSPELESLRTMTCDRYAARLTNIPDGSQVGAGPFVDFVLDTMRRKTNAEIAIINRGALGDVFPVEGPISELRLRNMLPVDDGLQTVDLKGSQLMPLMGLLTHPMAAVLGLAPGKVASRPLNPLRTYRVVTVDFVAGGGDGLVAEGAFPFEPFPMLGGLRELVARRIRGQGMSFEKGRLYPDLSWPVLYTTFVSLTGNLKTVSIQGGSGYAAPQLTRDAFLGLGAVFDLSAIADFERHRLQLTERTKYGVARTGRLPAAENEDVTTAEFAYLARLANSARPIYVPDASAATSLETELTVPSDRRYRHALFTVGVGPSWPLREQFSIRMQLGVRRELLARVGASDPEEAEQAGTRLALLSVAELQRIPITDGPRPVAGSGKLEHSVDLSGRIRDHILRGRLDLELPISAWLALTAGVELYVQHRLEEAMQHDVGVAIDTVFGLRTSTDLSLASF